MALKHSRKVCFVNNYTYNYVRNINSATKRFSYDLIEKYSKLLIKIKEVITKEEMLEDFKDDYNYAVVRQINNSFKKYFFTKKNNKKSCQLKREFNEFLNEEPYYTAVKKISMKAVPTKRKLMLFCVRRKWFKALKFMYAVNREKKL